MAAPRYKVQYMNKQKGKLDYLRDSKGRIRYYSLQRALTLARAKSLAQKSSKVVKV